MSSGDSDVMTKPNNQENNSDDRAVDNYLKNLEESIKREQKSFNPPTSPRTAPKPWHKPEPPHQDRTSEPDPESEPATPPPPPVAPAPVAKKQQAAPPSAEPSPRPGVFEQGDILKIDDGTLAVYQSPVPGKEYDLVMFLLPDGRVDARGVMIYAYDCEKIGHLPPLYFEKLRHLMQWNRDLVIFHLDRYEWCKHVLMPTNPDVMRAPDKTPLPHRTPPPRQHVPAEYQTGPHVPDRRPEQMLQKGRRITLKMGAKEWSAVYWGKDDLGHLLAHHTHGDWSLLHMDLDRFHNAIKYEELLTPDEIKKMDESILKSYSE